MLVTRIAKGDHAKTDNFVEAWAGVVQEFFGRLVQISSALIEVELATFEKQMRMRVDEAGEQHEFGEIGVGRVLIRVQ